MCDDSTLLRRYAAEHSDAAFAEFVRRHLPPAQLAVLRQHAARRQPTATAPVSPRPHN